MENLGKYLKDLRGEKGLSRDEVFNEIRIHADVIQKIEENKLSSIGNYGLVKAVVYNYARFLDADLNLVMAEFNVMMPESIKKEFVPRRIIKADKILLSTNLFWSIGILIIVIILGSILFNAYTRGWLKSPEFFSKDKRKTEKVAEKTENEDDKPEEMRQRMLELNEKLPDGDATGDARQRKDVGSDNVDYLGNILGDSPINISID